MVHSPADCKHLCYEQAVTACSCKDGFIQNFLVGMSQPCSQSRPGVTYTYSGIRSSTASQPLGIIVYSLHKSIDQCTFIIGWHEPTCLTMVNDLAWAVSVNSDSWEPTGHPFNEHLPKLLTH